MTHEQVCEMLAKIYYAKNKDYGNSFDTTIDKFGDIAFVVRASDKMMRLEQLVNNDAVVKDESFDDTVKDLANYCIMYLMRGQYSAEMTGFVVPWLH